VKDARHQPGATDPTAGRLFNRTAPNIWTVPSPLVGTRVLLVFPQLCQICTRNNRFVGRLPSLRSTLDLLHCNLRAHVFQSSRSFVCCRSSSDCVLHSCRFSSVSLEPGGSDVRTDHTLLFISPMTRDVRYLWSLVNMARSYWESASSFAC